MNLAALQPGILGEGDSRGGICPGCAVPAAAPFFRQAAVPAHSSLLLADRETALAFPRGELELTACGSCGLVFNQSFRPELMRYGPDCEETQSSSATFLAYAGALAERWIERYQLVGGRILEIGCGKGEFLALICRLAAAEGIGFDPAFDPARAPHEPGLRIDWRRECYGPAQAGMAADLVVCRHTLEHIAPVGQFLAMLRRNMGERPSVLALEVPALEPILELGAFWDIYHEHCSYFTAQSLGRLVSLAGFEVLALSREYGGQYLVLEARPRAGEAPPPAVVPGPPAEGAAADRDLTLRMTHALAFWQRRLRDWRGQGRRVALWGSGSKAVGFLSALGSAADVVELVVDLNPRRHGWFMPGCGQPIVAPAMLRQYRPDIVIAMNPIYREEIGRDLAALGLQSQLLAIDELEGTIGL